MLEANGARLCSESFGAPEDTPILLITGLGSSMLWWDAEFCRRLADGGRFVIRYDHRDTGRSTTYEPGHPGYTGTDLVTDALAVLDAYGIASAHLVGVSAGGAIAQLLALDFADRVRSLVLISTSPALPAGHELPPPTAAFTRFVATATVDWSNADSVVQYLVDYSRMLAGDERRFDENAFRDLVQRDVERADDIAASQNHDLLADDERAPGALSSITVPTLVIHGTADPMFPLRHGEVAERIPTAKLLSLPGAGHGVDPADWDTIAPAILEHTAGVRRIGNIDFYDAELRLLDEHFRAAVDVRSRDRVLDIGCGTGQSTRAAARVAVAGSVLGVDLSAPMLERARRLTENEGLRNVAYQQADAQVHPFPAQHFDLCISRFGTMFFSDPVAAFGNIGNALRPGARLVLLVWQEHDRNEWATAIRAAITGTATPYSPIGPGAFSLADPTDTEGILAAAGFVDVGYTEVHEPVYYGPDVDTAYDAVLGLQAPKNLLASLDATLAEAARQRLRATLATHDTGNGVYFDARAWIVTAGRP